ncbi:hypothetical protein ACHAPJ_010401 [Fusarium lateritium]
MLLLFSTLLQGALAAKFTTQNWAGEFQDGSGVLRSLRPSVQNDFDFSPSDVFDKRNGVGNYHVGDLTFRWRLSGQSDWKDEDSAANRGTLPESNSEGSLLHSNFNKVFSDAAPHLNVTRDWIEHQGDLVLKATLQNSGSQAVELGAFGFPIEFNNIFTGRTAEDTTAKCVLVDPYIGQDAGYLQVTRLTGTGPHLLITPNDSSTPLEGWRFLPEPNNDDLGYQQQTYEGNYAWQALTKAYADKEWSSTDPWNSPRSAIIAPGDSITFSIRFSTTDEVWNIEDSLAAQGLPVAVGLPGYVLPTDVDGRLYLRTTSDVTSISTLPSNALKFAPMSSPDGKIKAYAVNASPHAFGRVRATVLYKDGRNQTVHYFVTAPALDTANKLGAFHFQQQYYTNLSDVFHRAPSVMLYDYEKKEIVLQDDLVYLAGLSDDGGAGAFEAASMKVYGRPDKSQVAKMEDMANKVILGQLQYASGDLKYAVRRSIFYWDPAAVPQYAYDPNVPYAPGLSWNKKETEEVWRTFNVPHVVALWYSLYRAERMEPGILKQRSRAYYLDIAYNTIRVATTKLGDGNPGEFAAFGMMGETLWPFLIHDLRFEGNTTAADDLQKIMKARQSVWAGEGNPFGSEQAWDSTGEPAVYAWSRFFNDQGLMDKTLDAVRGYMPTVAHWGWNGNARRYWDFGTAGKLRRTERMLHHYGSGQNSLPLLDAFRYYANSSSPKAFYDLRVGFGGHMGPLSNINQDGFASMAFHSFPDTMKWDAYSGDYGPNFLAHIQGSATYLVQHPTYGWVAMGGNVKVQGSLVNVAPKDTVRKQLYIAPMGLWVRFDAGQVTEFTYDAAKKTVRIQLGRVDGLKAASTTMFYENTLPLGAKLKTSLRRKADGYTVGIPSSVVFSM